VPCLHLHLNCKLLGGGNVILGALDLVGMPMVAIFFLDLLVLLEEVGEDGIKNFDVRPCASEVQTLNPHKVPPQMSIPSL
jgi:hypothetical protein